MGIFSLGYGFFTYFRGGGRILKLGRTRVCLTFDNWKIVVISNKPEDNITFYISARSKDMFIPRSVLVILACNPVRTRVCITLGN